MPKTFLAVAVALAGALLGARAVVAIASADVLDWDETYYASITATAAHGLGLYPYVMGYPSIPNMGGIGYVVFLYALAYKLLGPDLVALRLVSFLVSLIAVAGLVVLTKRLYGSAAGLAALALTPALLVFERSNSIRLDVFATAFVAWALVLYSHVSEKRHSPAWHVLVGFTFALGLEVHLHTAAAALAVGFAYVVDLIKEVKRGGRIVTVMKPLAGFVAGSVLGAMLFVAVSVAPNPRDFFRTAALARLSAADSSTQLNLSASMDRSKLVQTFLSPALIVPKEIARYRSLFAEMRWWEALLWLCALPAFVLLRKTPNAFNARALLLGAVIGGGIVFNGSSVLYLSAILPFFVPALATFVSHGVSTRPHVNTGDVSRGSLLLLIALSLAILPPVLSRTARTFEQLRQPEATPPIVEMVRAASTECIVAGPTDLYARYFMSYPKFVGTRPVEVMIGSTYYDMQDRVAAYWSEKHPDVVFGKPDAALTDYLTQAKYIEVAEGLWQKPNGLSAGCVITVR